MSRTLPDDFSRVASSRTLLIVLVVVTLAVLVGGIVAAAFYHAWIFRTDNSHISGSMINGDNLQEALFITTNSTIHVVGNYDAITLNLNSNIKIRLDVPGSHNNVTIRSGYTNLSIEGDYNSVNARTTHTLSQTVIGYGDVINR